MSQHPYYDPATRDQLQQLTMGWCNETLSTDVDKATRLKRFFEEATEFVQACGLTRDDCHFLVDYVFNRPVGEPFQEVGGVLITLDLAAGFQDISTEEAHLTEWRRINQPAVIEKIKRRQVEKREAGL